MVKKGKEWEAGTQVYLHKFFFWQLRYVADNNLVHSYVVVKQNKKKENEIMCNVE